MRLTKDKNHAAYYIVLILILGSGFFMTVLATPHKQLQMVTIVMTTFFYIAWGILHHLVNHNLTAKIVIEYVLIGSFGLSAVFFLLKGGLL